MKVALLGGGKTGGKVVDIVGESNVTVFDTSNVPTSESIAEHDVVISFLPGPAFTSYIDMLVESKVSVVTGSTGFDFPEGFEDRLKSLGLVWLSASNFSLGMNLVHGMIDVLSKTNKVFTEDEYGFKLHEVHHTKKLDAPSGTALTWADWLGLDADITSAREGDVVGDHKLTLNVPYEQISLQHVASDRKVFAQGAVWAANKVHTGGLKPGLHHMQDIMKKELGI